MLASNSLSAGVYTNVINRSQRLTARATSIGAMVAAAKKGPIGVPTLVTDNEELFSTFGQKDPRFSKAHYAAEAFLQDANRLYFTRVARDTQYGTVVVFTDNNFSATRHVGGLDSPTDLALDPTDIMLIHGINQGTWNNNIWVEFFPDVNDASGDAFFLNVYQGDSTVAVESWRCTCFDKVDNSGAQLYIEDVVNQRSNYINVRFNTNHVEFQNTARPNLINAVGGGQFDDVNNELNGQLTGGDDGNPVTTGDIIQGWDLYQDVELIQVNILINGGYAEPAIQLKMDQICEVRQDCIAILDLPSNMQETQQAVDYRRNVLNLNSSLSALYGPDLKIRDTTNGVDVWVPPSGHVAGIYSRTDEQAATWFAPAGIERGQLNGIIDLRVNYNQGARNVVDENQINLIRSISGQGTVVWGAATLEAVKSALNDVGVRRLLALLQSSVKIQNLYAVFKPNDSLLRDRQRATLVALLEPILRGRGLYWYDVICDERNNPPEVIANGDLIVDVYLDPTRYTKRIHLNAVVPKTGGLQAAVELIERTS